MTDFVNGSLRKRDWMIASSLFLFTLASRLPWASRLLSNSDSTRFGLALEHFDVAAMRPHAPGYILYVAAAKVADLFLHNAALSLVGVNIVASSLTIFVLYILAAKMYGRSTALVSSLLLAVSPLFWFNGEMAFTYAFEGLFCALLGLACYLAARGERSWELASAVFLGLATGVRQNIVIFLVPVWLFSIRKLPLKRILATFLLFGFVCLAWFLPLLALSGGLKAYLQILGAQYHAAVADPAPLLFQFRVRAGILASFLAYSLALGMVPLVYGLGSVFRLPDILRDIRLRFLLIWILPAPLFFVGVTLWNPGQIIVILPPVFIALAESLRVFSADLAEGAAGLTKHSRPRVAGLFETVSTPTAMLALLTVAVAFTSSLLFIRADTPLSRAAIGREDVRLAELLRLTRENTDPAKTMILACQLNTQAGYYLRDYRVFCPFPMIFRESDVPIGSQNLYVSFGGRTTPRGYWVPTGFEISPIRIPEGVNRLVVWEGDVAGYYRTKGRTLDVVSSPRSGTVIYSLKVAPGEEILYGYHEWSLRDAAVPR